MSVVDRDKISVSLPKTGPDTFWKEVSRRYASPEAVRRPDGRRPGKSRRQSVADQRWRALAMLALRENAGWSMDRIGRAFGRDRGHVSRCLRQVAEELRETFGCEPTMDVNTQPILDNDPLLGIDEFDDDLDTEAD